MAEELPNNEAREKLAIPEGLQRILDQIVKPNFAFEKVEGRLDDWFRANKYLEKIPYLIGELEKLIESESPSRNDAFGGLKRIKEFSTAMEVATREKEEYAEKWADVDIDAFTELAQELFRAAINKGLKTFLDSLKDLYDPESGNFRREREEDEMIEQHEINTHYIGEFNYTRDFFVAADSAGYEIPSDLREAYFELFTTMHDEMTRESAEEQLRRYIDKAKKEK